jgi:hypothetical protein
MIVFNVLLSQTFASGVLHTYNGVYSTHLEVQKYLTKFLPQNLKERDHLKALGV